MNRDSPETMKITCDYERNTFIPQFFLLELIQATETERVIRNLTIKVSF